MNETLEGKVRFKFHKIGKLKFISHLDLMRTMKGALGRAKVPLKYSEGFNPHPKMVFSLPLPVGAESICEYLDVVLTEPCDREELLCAVNAQLTSELKVLDVYPVQMDLRDIAGAEYDFFFGDLNQEELERALEGDLPIEKKSKKGMITVDLRPKIAGYGIETTDGRLRFHALLGADSGDFVNPELLVRAIERKVGHPIEYYSIMRLELYTTGGEPFR